MAEFKSAVITKKGVALMGKIMSGSTKLNFSKIVTSDTTYRQDQLANLSALTGIKQEALISGVKRKNEATVEVSTQFSNTALRAGYYVRTLGLYAVDPSEGDILYSVCIVDESVSTPDYMPPYNGVGVSSLLINMVTTVSNAANVTVTVDPAAAATVSQVMDLQAQVDDLKGFTGYMDQDIYGVEVDFNAKKCVRLAGAVGRSEGEFFDNIAPWGGRKRVILSDDGYELGSYGDPQYTETGKLVQAVNVEITPEKPGSPSATPAVLKNFPIGTPVQVMVKQPKFWVKVVPLSMSKAAHGRGYQFDKARYYVSPTAKPGFMVIDTFKAANGQEQDYIYLSAFEGSLYDTSENAYIMDDAQVADFAKDTGDKLCSIAGAKPASGKTQNLTRANTRALCNNRNANVEADNAAGGLGWRQHDIFALSITQILMLVEYAHFDAQAKIGKGVSSLVDDGASNMALVTGGTSSLGNKSGNAPDGEDGKRSVTYRGEENLWGNIWTWLDGINIECKDIQNAYVSSDNLTMKDDTKENYENAGFTLAKANGIVSKFGLDEKHPYLFLPTETKGASNFVGAYHWCNPTYNGFVVALLGGRWHIGSYCSPFCLFVSNTSGYRYRGIGGRLLYVPQADKPKYLYKVMAA